MLFELLHRDRLFFKQRDGQANACEEGCGDQAVMAASDNNDVRVYAGPSREGLKKDQPE